MTYRVKYMVQATYENRPANMVGTKPDPKIWANEASIIEHDKYYAWMKHKAQAKFRGEDYKLTYDDWVDLWPNDKWLNRGRRSTDYSLARIDPTLPWDISNVAVEKRSEYLKRAKEYRKIKSEQ